ncbi:MAG: prolyl-tRNA synthetase associated domain-containing protein [Alphaproteobacteria bacterium]|nr:prolyl-tRNA synthetase associated domain-containing protein [Alphaproteobacteria bacterium]
MSNPAPTADSEPLPTQPEELLELLQQLDIEYKYYEHEAVFTVEESSKIKEEMPGTHCRNLYLRDKKKKNFLVVAANETEVDLKTLQEKIECGRLSFGSADRLWQFLGIRPGSVCPFTVINDTDHEVQVVLDAYMMKQECVHYHPLDNTMTIGLSPDDLLKFFDHTGHEPIILDL